MSATYLVKGTDPSLRDRTVVQGDPSTPGRWESELDGCDAVVNLAGHNLFAERWNGRHLRPYLAKYMTGSMLYNMQVAQVLVERAKTEADTKQPTINAWNYIGYTGYFPALSEALGQWQGSGL